MLIRRVHLERIAAGDVTLAFRRWRRPTVKSGGTLRTAVGALAIESVDAVDQASLSPEDARAAGYSSLGELLAELDSHLEGTLYRIRLRRVGPDPRARLREEADLTPDDLAQLQRKLALWDSRSTARPWTTAVLREIAANPGTRAAAMAERLEVEKDWLKVHIRKLKELGLTESLETGYRLSPRGEAFLAALE